MGSFLSSISALCLPIFGTYLCDDAPLITQLAGYSDDADMYDLKYRLPDIMVRLFFDLINLFINKIQ